MRGELVYEPDVDQVPFAFAQRLARAGLRALVAAPLLAYTALQQAYEDLRHSQQAVMQQERLRALGQMASQRMAAENELPAHIDRVLSKPPKLTELRRVLAEVVTT